MEQRKGFHPGELIDPGFLAQSSLGSLHAPQAAPKEGSPGALGQDVSPNHCSDSPLVQLGQSQQRKHHFFPEQTWNHFTRANGLISGTLSIEQIK